MGLHRYGTVSVGEFPDDLPDDHDFVQAICEILDEIYDVPMEDPPRFADISWYDLEDDMKELSALFPGVLFVVSVEEGSGERWIGYFKDGKEQICSSEVVYEEFDESKMK